jgi:ADP-ribosylglycohydrolase
MLAGARRIADHGRVVDKTAVRDSVQGVALGDAFGQSWFGRPAALVEEELAARRLPEPPWRWTDDTAMTLDLVTVLSAYGRVEPDALAERFASTYRAEPDRDYGPSMHRVLTALGAGEPWAAVTARQFGGQGSWGNGAAMRVAPLGVWWAADLDEAAGHARAQAATTHAHPEAAAGAVAVAVAAALSVRGVPATELLPAVLDRTPPGEVATGLRRAARLSPALDPRHAAAVLGCGARISAPDTVPYAVWCAARHLDDLVEALWATASAGGDTDTTCAIVGGIVAPRTGLAAVPATWLAAREPVPDRVW